MALLRWIIGGFIGGAIGVLIWVTFGYMTEYEGRAIAWGVGFLVGAGVRYGAHLSNQEEGIAQGALASLMAIGAIITAKYLLLSILIGNSQSSIDDTLKLARAILSGDEGVIASFASEMAAEKIARGETINWPPGMSFETASNRWDFPPEIWQQAETRWQQLGKEGQIRERTQRLTLAPRGSGAASTPRMSEMFSPWDILWFGLAAVTAFRVAVGLHRADATN